MRIAVLILGLLLGLLMFIQTVIVYGLSNAVDEENTAGAAAIGVFMSLLWLVACALVIAFPRVALGFFAAAGILGFAASGEFPDLAIWGGASLVLAGMSYFGYRGKRKQQAKEAERDKLIQQGAHAQVQLAGFMAQQSSRSCPQCGTANGDGARFCANCGAQIASVATA